MVVLAVVDSSSLTEDKDRAVIHGMAADDGRGDGVDDDIRIDYCWVGALVEQLC